MNRKMTARFGEIEYDDTNILYFSNGIIGFPELQKFVLLDHTRKHSCFQWIQSLDDDDFAFVIVDPKHLKIDYKVQLENDDALFLGIEHPDEIWVGVIVNLYPKPRLNLKAPLVVNHKTRQGKQIIMPNYPLRHDIEHNLSAFL